VVGGIEALGLLVDRFHFTGTFWGLVGKLNGNFGLLGYGLVGLFVVSWIFSIAIYRWHGFDRVELNTEAGKRVQVPQ
jgi:nickel/cobalt transporter (NiCoT) family protein